MLEKLARASLSVVAPTVMAVLALQGDMEQLSPPLLLPAGSTTDLQQHQVGWHRPLARAAQCCSGSQ
jgi:hypothetical protein